MSDVQTAQTSVERTLEEAGRLRPLSKQEVIILGGQFLADALPSFLEAWAAVWESLATWQLLESASCFEVRYQQSLPSLMEKLEKGGVERFRLFGERGDLMLRRDEERLFWRFVGAAEEVWPDLAAFDPQDFWVAFPNTRLNQREVRAYQWHGEERRVKLRWPEGSGLTSKGTILVQHHYLERGRIAFVRFIGFESQEGEHGEGND